MLRERADRAALMRCPACEGTGLAPATTREYRRDRHVRPGSIETVRNRILLHLFDLSYDDGDEDAMVAPYAATLGGIGRALGISRPHVSVQVNLARDRGHVVVLLRHVKGMHRRLRTYAITPAGVQAALAAVQDGRTGGGR